MTKYYCDKCGKEMSGHRVRMEVEDTSAAECKIYFVSDICIDCAKELQKEYDQRMKNEK